MNFIPDSETAMGGVVCYQNERFNIVFGKTIRNGKPVLTVVRTAAGKQTIEGTYEISKDKAETPLLLQVTGRAGKYSFAVSSGHDDWQEVATDVDATILSTQKAGGFTGTIIGMYTQK